MFDKLFGAEAGPVINYLFAFALVIALIFLAFWLFKRFFNRSNFNFGPRTGQRRLGVVEASGVDGNRRLILIRRDDVEHLVLIGGSADLLVEGNINREAEIAAQNKPQQPLQPAPKPLAPLAQTPQTRPMQAPQRPQSTATTQPATQPRSAYAPAPQRPAAPRPIEQKPLEQKPQASPQPSQTPERRPLSNLDWPGTSERGRDTGNQG